MKQTEKQKRVSRIVFGVLLIALGVVFTLDNLGLFEAGRLSGYWPLLLLAMGLPSLTAPKDGGDPVWGVVLTALGGFFLARKFDVIEWSYWDVWPVFLLLAGLTLIVQSSASTAPSWCGSTAFARSSSTRRTAGRRSWPTARASPSAGRGMIG